MNRPEASIRQTGSISGPLVDLFPKMNDLNIGIILIGVYYVLEFGSVQSLYPVILEIRLPFIMSLASVIYAVYLAIKGRVNFKTKTTQIFTLLCLFIIIYSIISTKDPDIRWNMVKAFTGYLAYFLIFMASVKKTTQFILLVDIMLVSVLFSSYNGIMQGGRIWGSTWLKDENTISLIAAMIVPFAYFLMTMYKSKIKKLFYLLCLLFFVGINIVAHSRGGTLSLIIAAFFIILLSSHKVRNLLIVFSFAILVIIFAPPAFFEEMSTLKQGTEEGTAADRIYLWAFCWEMYKDNPILGVGPSNYPYYFSAYEKGRKYNIGAQRPPHTTPLQWLAEMGTIGMIILLSLQMSLYKNWKSVKILGKKNEDPIQEKSNDLLVYITHACAISQVSFWFGSIFLSLIPYPFYWFLPYFSEAWKNITFSKPSNEVKSVDL